MANGFGYLIEEEEYFARNGAKEPTFVVSLGAAKGTDLVPLAFSVPDDLPPISVDGAAISWTPEAMATFAKMRDEAKVRDPDFERNLPYASLRGFMEVALPDVSRIEPRMGLDNYALRSNKNPIPFVYLDSAPHDVRNNVRSILDDWLTNFLMPTYAIPGEVPRALRDRVLDLAAREKLVSVETVRACLLPWLSGATGTALPPDKRGFQLLVDHAARLLAGKELFGGCGPIRRVLMSRPGTQSVADLITEPIKIPGRGMFSLVVSLEVVTFPSISQPLLRMDVHKRLWLAGLSQKATDHRGIRGTVFSSKHADRAVSFQVRYRKCEDGVRRWEPDNAYEALKRELALPLARMDGYDIARGDASTATSRVVLVHRDGIAEAEHGLKFGVPELDKLEAFRSVRDVLSGCGIAPFAAYKRLTPKHGKGHEHLSRMINAPTLLGAALEALERGSTDLLTPQYLTTLNDSQIDALLRRQFSLGLEEIKRGYRIVRYQNLFGQDERDQSVNLDDIIAANREAVQNMYPGRKPLLLILHEDGADTQLRILLSVIQLLWGGALEIIANHLPRDVHGSRVGLPGKDLSDSHRTELRRDAWRHLAQQIAEEHRQVFCLVMARDWYKCADGNRRKDDRVNKPTARQALASIGAACVQYLLPPTTSRDGAVDVAQFLHRAQAAMKDLISAHSGRIDGIRDAVAGCFEGSDTTKASMPREIIGITLVRKEPGRARGNVETTFLPIAIRIDVGTGRCDLCCAYEGPRGLTISRWERFADGLVTVSRVSPVRLAEKREIAQTRFMDFVDQVISSSVEDGAQPIVLIDSSNCVYLWSWLADRRLDVAKIEVGQKQWMQEAWKGARIIRIRQDLAPGIIECKEQSFSYSALDDTRQRSELTADIRLEVPSSRVGLFRLESDSGTSGCVCYLSVGRKTLHMNKRGASCYRSTEAAVPYTVDGGAGEASRVCNKAGIPVLALKTRPVWAGQWPTPNPLEIVVSLRQSSDDPDRLAELVERLRYGFGHYSEWTALPAPLFFERVVRDYISAFAIENDEDDHVDAHQVDSD